MGAGCRSGRQWISECASRRSRHTPAGPRPWAIRPERPRRGPRWTALCPGGVGRDEELAGRHQRARCLSPQPDDRRACGLGSAGVFRWTLRIGIGLPGAGQYGRPLFDGMVASDSPDAGICGGAPGHLRELAGGGQPWLSRASIIALPGCSPSSIRALSITARFRSISAESEGP